MRVERIYIPCCRRDLCYLRCCVASIRQWYPDLPISIIRDESQGDFDTEALERYWDVEVFPTERRLLGLGFGKLEPLFLERRERCFLLDADTVFIGPVLDRFEARDEEFVVDGSHPIDQVEVLGFDLAKLAEVDPEFVWPGYVFNTGQLVATTGILRREDFEPHIAFEEPPRLRRPDVFPLGGEQGVLNYVLMRKQGDGALSVGSDEFMLWPPRLAPTDIDVEQLTPDSNFPYVLHWAGVAKGVFFHDTPMLHVLEHFEALYYARTPATRAERLQLAAEKLLRSHPHTQ